MSGTGDEIDLVQRLQAIRERDPRAALLLEHMLAAPPSERQRMLVEVRRRIELLEQEGQ